MTYKGWTITGCALNGFGAQRAVAGLPGFAWVLAASLEELHAAIDAEIDRHT